MKECDFDNELMTCAACGFVAGGRDWHKICPKAEGYVAPVVSMAGCKKCGKNQDPAALKQRILDRKRAIDGGSPT